MVKKILFILLLVPISLFSQISDFEIWSSLNIEYKINKRNELNFEESVRTFQNSTNWASVFSNISYEHRLKKIISIGTGYRYTVRNNLDNTLNGHRFYVYLKAQKKLNDFTFSYRLAFQTEYIGINQREDWQTPKSYNRNLFKLRYKISKKIKPYFSYEFYYLIGESFYFSNKYRLTAGFNYRFNKKNSINIFYRYQKVQFNSNVNLYILGLSYKYSIK